MRESVGRFFELCQYLIFRDTDKKIHVNEICKRIGEIDYKFNFIFTDCLQDILVYRQHGTVEGITPDEFLAILSKCTGARVEGPQGRGFLARSRQNLRCETTVLLTPDGDEVMVSWEGLRTPDNVTAFWPPSYQD